MATYMRYDWVNEKVVDFYKTTADIIKCANEFYHNTFVGEEDYDENLEIKNIEDAIELYEGSGFSIYMLLEDIINGILK